jgi:hypothetical protein
MWLVAMLAGLAVTFGGTLHFALGDHALCPLDGRLHHAEDLHAYGGQQDADHDHGRGPGHSHDEPGCPWALLLHNVEPSLPIGPLPVTLAVHFAPAVRPPMVPVVRRQALYALAPSHSPPAETGPAATLRSEAAAARARLATGV